MIINYVIEIDYINYFYLFSVNNKQVGRKYNEYKTTQRKRHSEEGTKTFVN